MSSSALTHDDILCVYDGPSVYTGEPIRAYIYPHENTKTDNCAGLTVAPRDITNYFDARRSGQDAHVCGNCPYASKPAGGNGRCYVGNGSRVGLSLKGPLTTGSTIQNVADDEETVYAFFRRHKFTRLRSAIWGDAAALPPLVWDMIHGPAQARGMSILGYTHGYATIGYGRIQHLQSSHVASVHDITQANIAMANGWRYFRTAPAGEKRQKHEFHCPASAERGHKIQCSDCLACGSIGNQKDQGNGLIYDHDGSAAGIHVIKRMLKDLALSKATPLTTLAA